jgi:hypothetical protein
LILANSGIFCDNALFPDFAKSIFICHVCLPDK